MRFSALLNRAAGCFSTLLPMITLCYTGNSLMLPVALAIVCHELAHLGAIRLFHGKILGFSAAPFGLRIRLCEGSLSFFDEGVVSLAGCLANLLLAALSFLLYKLFSVDLINFGCANLLLGLINLLPLKALDGGRFLELFLSYFFWESLAFSVSMWLSLFGSLMLFLVSSYTLVTTGAGLYPLLFSIYLFARVAFCENRRF